MALELSYVYIKYIYGKEKAEFQKPYSITDDNNCWKIEGKTTEDVRRKFYNTNSEKRWASVGCNTQNNPLFRRFKYFTKVCFVMILCTI